MFSPAALTCGWVDGLCAVTVCEMRGAAGKAWNVEVVINHHGLRGEYLFNMIVGDLDEK